MFKRLISNYNMSFIKDILADKGKEKWEAGIDNWGYHLEESYGYGFYGKTEKLKGKGEYSVNLTLGYGYYNDKIEWDCINVEIACIWNPLKDYYLLHIRRDDYKTYGVVNLRSMKYNYEGEIDNKMLNKFAKIIREMYEESVIEWEESPKRTKIIGRGFAGL